MSFSTYQIGPPPFWRNLPAYAEFVERLESPIPADRQHIRIGCSILVVEVTPEHVVYGDEDGSEHHLDLAQCAAQWVRWHEEHDDDFVRFPGVDPEESRAWNARCVGERGACDDPPWVELRREPRTRFEFKSYEAVYEELLGPLGQAGWHTFDAK